MLKRFKMRCKFGIEDKAMAASWYTKAAEKGVITAQVSLGKCYLYEEGATLNDGQE